MNLPRWAANPWILGGPLIAVLTLGGAFEMACSSDHATSADVSKPTATPVASAPRTAVAPPVPPKSTREMYPVDAGAATPPADFVYFVAVLPSGIETHKTFSVVKPEQPIECPGDMDWERTSPKSEFNDPMFCGSTKGLGAEVAGVIDAREACDEMVKCSKCMPNPLSHCDKAKKAAARAWAALRAIGIDPGRHTGQQ